MFKRRFLSLLVCIGVVFVVVATALPAYAFKWPKNIVFGTTAVGTGCHRATSALAPIMEQEIGIKVRVVPEGNPSKRYLRFVEGTYNILVCSISEMEMAVSGMGAYADKPRAQVRILWNQSDTPWLFAAPGNTKLKDIYDIKTTPGVKIANNNSSPAMTVTVKGGLLSFLQLTEKDVTIVPCGGYPSNVRSINEGKADVTLCSPNSSVTHEIAGTPIGVKWLDLPLSDKAGWKRLLKYRTTAIPAVVTWGVKSAVGHQGYTSNFLYWVLKDTDPELVYNLSKWIYTKFDTYKHADKALTRMDMKIWRAFLDSCPAPVHASTVKYLKEIGQWTAKDDVWQAEAVKQVEAYGQAWAKAIAEAKRKKINIRTTNKEWLDLWNSHKKGLKRLASRVD